MLGADRGNEGCDLFRQIIDEHLAEPHVGAHAQLFGRGFGHGRRHTDIAQGFADLFHLIGTARGMQCDPAEVVPGLAAPVEPGKALAEALNGVTGISDVVSKPPVMPPMESLVVQVTRTPWPSAA